MTQVTARIATYPEMAQRRLHKLRQWLLEVAGEHELGAVTESLKWGEPSFQVKSGSTVRIDWKPSDPDHYFVYFHCQSRLVETFRELYGDRFTFEGNRAIVFGLYDDIPEDALKHCFLLACRYHKIKHLPLLGA